MAKITKITHNSKKYFDLALKKGERGDNIACLNLLYSAQDNIEELFSDEDFDIRLEIAETYAKMGIISESNKHYFRMLNYDYCIDETLFSIIRNFLMLENDSAAAFYVQFGLSEGIFDEDDNIESLITHIVPENRPRLVKTDDNEYVMQVAKQLMNSDDVEYSRQMLNTISPSSEYYEEALNCLALIEMKSGAIDNGIEYCDKVLERVPTNLSALTTKLLGLKMLAKDYEADQIIDILESISINNISEISRLVICFAELGNDELTRKYTEMALRLSPYDLDMAILNICAEFNLGNCDKAKKLLGNLFVIYPDEIEPVLLLWKLEAAHKNGIKLKLSAGLTDADYDYIYRNLELITATCNDSEDMLSAFDNDRIHYLCYYALLKSGQNIPLINTLNKLFCSKNCDVFYGNLSIVRDFLADPAIPMISKKNLFFHAIHEECYTMSAVISNNKARWFSPFINGYKFKNSELKDVYCKLYSSLSFLDVDFERKLKLRYKKLADTVYSIYSKNSKLSANSLAAVFAYLTKINVIFSKPESCCEIFDGNIDEFNLYLKEINLKTDENKAVKNTAKVKTKTKEKAET